MLETLSRYWWLVALRGVVAILFGVLAFVWPGLTIEVLVLLFGVYALVDGLGSIITGLMHRRGSDRWWLLFEGLASIVFGVLTVIWPGVTAVVLLIFIAAWAIVTGIFEILIAINLRQELKGEWVLAASGVLSILFGAFMLFRPGAGALAVVWMIGAYSVLFGALLIYLGLKLRDGVATLTIPEAR